MAAPAFRAAGAQFANQNAVSAGLPAGFQAGDFHLLVVETSNEPLPAITGWLGVGSGSINVAVTSVTSLTARYRIAVGGDTAPTVPDSGDHQVGRIFGFSGVDTASPFDGTPVFTTDNGTSSTVSFPTLTTTVADCMIVHVVVSGFDNATSQVTGSGTNAALTGLTNRGNGWVITGLGGGYAVITGVKATAGSIGTTTVTHTTTGHPRALLTFALKPVAEVPPLPVDQRVKVIQDKWRKARKGRDRRQLFQVNWSPREAITVQSAAVTAATETDSAGLLGKRRTLGVAVETDAAQTLTGRKRLAVGTVTETDSAQPLGAPKTALLGTATETDSAQAAGKAKTLLLGTASETDSARLVGKLKRLGIASETDSAEVIGGGLVQTGAAAEHIPVRVFQRNALEKVRRPRKRSQFIVDYGPPLVGGLVLALGTATETETAGDITRYVPPYEHIPVKVVRAKKRRVPKSAVWIARAPQPSTTLTLALGVAAETDSAQTVGKAKRAALGVASETDSAQVVVKSGAVLLGTATETDSARAVGKRKALGVAVETDSAQAFVRRKARLLGVASEADSAQPFTSRKVKALGTVSETDSAQPLTRRKSRLLGVASETDTARLFGKRKGLGVAVETDSAQTVGKFQGRFLTPVIETDTARPLGKRRLLGVASETDSAQALGKARRRLLGVASESDTAQALTKRKAKPVTVAVETDTARAVGKRRLITFAPEVDMAQPITGAKRKLISLASEVDSARPVTKLIPRQVGTATETDLARTAVRRMGAATAVELDESRPIGAVIIQPPHIVNPGLYIQPNQGALYISENTFTLRIGG